MKHITALLFALLVQCTFAQVNLSAGLTACYALDGSANEPVNGLAGTLHNVSAAADRFGNANAALAFGGNINSYVELPDNSLIKPSAISVSCWIKVASLSGTASNDGEVILFAQNSLFYSYFEAYALWINYYNNFDVRKADQNANEYVISNQTAVVPNTWYHLAFYAGPDSLKLYVNGVLEVAHSAPLTLNYGSEHVYLGGTNASPNYPYDGLIDNVRIYNRKLTNAEVSELYRSDYSCTSSVGISFLSKDEDEALLFPNPTTGKLTLSVPVGEATIQVKNLLGQEMTAAYTASDTSEIDLSSFPSGVYLLSVQSGDIIRSYKIVKE